MNKIIELKNSAEHFYGNKIAHFYMNECFKGIFLAVGFLILYELTDVNYMKLAYLIGVFFAWLWLALHGIYFLILNGGET